MGAAAGRLAESLSAAGIGPDAIDTVVITHAHSDHIGGLVDLATGTPRFPKAEVVLSDVELDLWTASDAANRLPEWAAQGLQDKQKTFHALRDHDREQGAQTRARLLDRVATDRVPVAGYHYPFPGVGHVVRDGGAYRWLPTDWSWSH